MKPKKGQVWKDGSGTEAILDDLRVKVVERWPERWTYVGEDKWFRIWKNYCSEHKMKGIYPANQLWPKKRYCPECYNNVQ